MVTFVSLLCSRSVKYNGKILYPLSNIYFALHHQYFSSSFCSTKRINGRKLLHLFASLVIENGTSEECKFTSYIFRTCVLYLVERISARLLSFMISQVSTWTSMGQYKNQAHSYKQFIVLIICTSDRPNLCASV